MNDLFDSLGAPAASTLRQPLAERVRPTRVEDVIGQDHLLGEGKPLALAIAAGRPHSMIFWGPPGVGKTTLARLMARAFDTEFIAISAVLAGVKEIRDAVERAKMSRDQLGRSTILFVDEVHRFNKSQQDAFLPHVESGLFTFIGATTENPSFEVNSALLSRAQVYVLKSLDASALVTLAQRGFAAEGVDANIVTGSPNATGNPFGTASGVQAKPSVASLSRAAERIAELADGDGRRTLNLVEQVAQAARVKQVPVDETLVASVVQRAARRFDKGGEEFYNQISALHKSVRGSDPDAALYWFCRMLDGGADPRYLARRIIRMASEDIGLADPRALEICVSAADVYERLGSPEGELALAEAVVFLAIAAKSNAVYKAYNAARAFIAQDDSRPVPLHIRNAPTKLMKDLEYGKDYRYAHDEAGGYAAGENYWPDGLKPQRWYQPSGRGLEGKIAEKLAELRARDAEYSQKKSTP